MANRSNKKVTERKRNLVTMSLEKTFVRLEPKGPNQLSPKRLFGWRQRHLSLF
jgi:hypothetical protein